MKKIYNSPVIKVVKITTIGMIATSQTQPLSGADSYTEGGTLSGARRARFSDWDFEEEE